MKKTISLPVVFTMMFLLAPGDSVAMPEKTLGPCEEVCTAEIPDWVSCTFGGIVIECLEYRWGTCFSPTTNSLTAFYKAGSQDSDPWKLEDKRWKVNEDRFPEQHPVRVDQSRADSAPHTFKNLPTHRRLKASPISTK